MSPFWLVHAAGSNTALLWTIGILTAAVIVMMSGVLRRAPRWRAAVIGVAVMLFAAPVYAVAFDPWWAAPWPSVYITAALAAGEFKCAAGFFECQFFLPPVAWGLVAAVAWHRGYLALAAPSSKASP